MSTVMPLFQQAALDTITLEHGPIVILEIILLFINITLQIKHTLQIKVY